MPVVQKTGPDGCLYILDWYDRYHCYQDANRDPAGIDRLKGRLYRVRYKDTPRAAGLRSVEGDRRAAHRAAATPGTTSSGSTAQRLLYERQLADINNPSGLPKRTGTREKLRQLIDGNDAPARQRAHALWVLVSTWEIDEGQTQYLMKNAEPWVQAWIVRMLGNARSGQRRPDRNDSQTWPRRFA